MNRRDTIKALGISTFSASILLEACKPGTNAKEKAVEAIPQDEAGKQPFEIERDKNLNKADKFFTSHEMLTITALADIIIPADEKSGSASDAKVPDFIEFIVKDMPQHQTPLRGGMRWLDMQCLKRYGQTFREINAQQQTEMVTEIAYPAKAKPEMRQGVAFFNKMRDLTATGFFTSKMGIKDLEYAGNKPNVWEGVPKDELVKYGLEGV